MEGDCQSICWNGNLGSLRDGILMVKIAVPKKGLMGARLGRESDDLIDLPEQFEWRFLTGRWEMSVYVPAL